MTAPPGHDQREIWKVGDASRQWVTAQNVETQCVGTVISTGPVRNAGDIWRVWTGPRAWSDCYLAGRENIAKLSTIRHHDRLTACPLGGDSHHNTRSSNI